MGVDAQRRPRRLEPQRLEEAVDWIERYREISEQNYQRLDALLEELKAKPGSPPGPTGRETRAFSPP